MHAPSEFSKTILLVGNDREAIAQLKDALTPHNYTCIHSSNAEQALEAIQQVQIDLVISSTAMPGMSGIEFIKQIATHWPHVLRILINSNSSNKMIANATSSGYLDAFLDGPFNSTKLVRLVDDVFSRQLQKTSDNLNQAIQSVTYTQRQQQQLAQGLFSGITLNTQNVILMLDAYYKITYWNNAAQQMFGYSAETAIGNTLGLVLVEDQNLTDILNQVTQSSSINPYMPTHQTIELAARHHSGAAFPIELTASAYQHDDSWHIVCSIRDITKNKLAESSLRASEDMFHNVVEKNNIGILAISRLGNCVFANKAAKNFIGEDHSELTKKILNHPPDPDKHNEIKIDKDDGDYVIAEVNSTRTLWKGSPVELIMLHDITARKKAELKAKEHEAKLQQIQKLESLGQMAAGIAHEINTPTQFVGDNAKYLQEAFADIESLLVAYDKLQDAIKNNNEVEEAAASAQSLMEEIDLDYLRKEIPNAIEHSIQGTQRISNIVQSMKYFSHPGKQTKEPTDINATIECAINIARNEWKYDADMSTELSPELHPVPCFPGEFNQAIINMIINATHAIKEAKQKDPERKGEIRIQTIKDEDWAQISISDNGTGIPEEIQNKIFDPFFTTKEAGVGTGQGLAIAYTTIVDKLGGDIAVTSEIGKGSTFTIRLPTEEPSGYSTDTASTL